MHPTSTLQIGQKRHIIRPTKWWYQEILALCGANMVPTSQEKITVKRRCVNELQELYSCIKKWDFDDLPCVDFKEALHRCIDENREHIAAQRKRILQAGSSFHIADETSAADTNVKNMTVNEINRLFSEWKQPDLGKRVLPMYRLPHQPYWMDIYGNKNKKGRKH